MIIDKLTINICGPAGFGIMTVGAMMSKMLHQCGLYIYSWTDYPSLIKGGHNQFLVRIDKEPLASGTLDMDVVVAFDKEGVQRHLDEISPNGALIYDTNAVKDMEVRRDGVTIIGIPLKDIAVKIGNKLYLNAVGYGAVCGLIEADKTIARNVISAQFKKKGDEVVNGNLQAFEEGYTYAKEHVGTFDRRIDVQHHQDNIVIDGNTAMALGAIKAGCTFISSYPMTPATSVMQTLALHEQEYNIIVKQTEDEIAAVNMAIGAAFTGARSMVATSGGGFSLMTEALGMAALAETPLVMIESQRGGPSTGIPTYTAQTDLRFVMHASQGEFPRIIIAPGDVTESFYEAFEAFNLAEIYQTPVIILSDKELATMHQTVPLFRTENLRINRGKLMTHEQMAQVSEKPFRRHKLTEDGISPRSLPGQPNGMHVASSYEHDETGYTSEDGRIHVLQTEKRHRKLSHMYDFITGVKAYGDDGCDIQFVLWGSTKGAALEAQKMLKNENINMKIVQILFCHPFPKKQFIEQFRPDKPAIIMEQNMLGQMRGIIREETGIFIEHFYGKYDARPFFAQQIIEQVKQVLGR